MNSIKLSKEKLQDYRNSICSFLEQQYQTEKKELLRLWPWERKILTDVFSTKDTSGKRLYNQAIVGLPRKNGKSTLSSGVGLYMLFCDEPNAEVYSIAGDKDQARIIFGKTKKAISRNRLFLNSAKIYRDIIEVRSTESIYQVLASDSDTAHGLNPSCVLADEVHVYPNRDLWDAMTTATAVRSQPLIFVTTTAGYDPTSLCYELYEQAIVKKDDPRIYGFWAEENLSPLVKQEYLEQQKRRLPLSVYQRLHENKWVGGESAFLTKEEVEQCKDSGLAEQHAGQPGCRYYLACDLGLVRDRTVLVVTHKGPDGLIYVDAVKTWRGSKVNPIQISEIEAQIEFFLKNFRIVKIICDPWQMQSSIQRLQSKGRPIEQFQFTPANLDHLSGNLYSLFRNKELRFYLHSELEKELLSVNAKQTGYGWRIDHENGRFSDHVIALGMSALFAIQEQATGHLKPSPFKVVAKPLSPPLDDEFRVTWDMKF